MSYIWPLATNRRACAGGGGGRRWAHKVGTPVGAQGGAQGTPPGWAHKGAHKGARKELPPGGRTRLHNAQRERAQGCMCCSTVLVWVWRDTHWMLEDDSHAWSFGVAASTIGDHWAHKVGSRCLRKGWAHKAPALCTHRVANRWAHKVGTPVGAQGRTRGAQGLKRPPCVRGVSANAHMLNTTRRHGNRNLRTHFWPLRWNQNVDTCSQQDIQNIQVNRTMCQLLS